VGYPIVDSYTRGFQPFWLSHNSSDFEISLNYSNSDNNKTNKITLFTADVAPLSGEIGDVPGNRDAQV